MTIRLVGNLPACTIANNGSGKVRVTFPAWDLDWELYDEVQTDQSWYVANVTRSETAAITAKGGTESGGYWFDTVDDFSGTSWATDDECAPQEQATINHHDTTALALAASSDYDTWYLYYDQNGYEVWYGQVISGSTTTGVHVIGGLARQRTMLASNAIIYYLIGNLDNLTTRLKFRNLSVQAYSQGLRHNDSGADVSVGWLAQRCRFIGGYNPIRQDTSSPGSDMRVENCVFIGSSSDPIYMPLIVTGDGGVYNCTFIRCVGYGTYGNNPVKNCLWYHCGNFINGAQMQYSVDTAAKIPSGNGNLRNQTRAQIAAWMDYANGYGDLLHYGLRTSSVCHGAGTPITGITKDINGNTRDGSTPTIGCFEAQTDEPFDVSWPAANKVNDDQAWTDFLNGAQVGSIDLPDIGNVTDDDTLEGVAGTFQVPAEADVKDAVGYGAGGTEYTGSYIVSVPNQPSFTFKSDGTGVTVDGDPGATNYLYARKDGEETGWTEIDSRSGDGDILFGSLAEGSYLFAVASKTSDSWSLMSDAARKYVGGTAQSVHKRIWLDAASALDAYASLAHFKVDREENRLGETFRAGGGPSAGEIPYMCGEWGEVKEDPDAEEYEAGIGRLDIFVLIDERADGAGRGFDLADECEKVIQCLDADRTRGDLVLRWAHRGTQNMGAVALPFRLARIRFEYLYGALPGARISV